jgi:hypothetical protein
VTTTTPKTPSFFGRLLRTAGIGLLLGYCGGGWASPISIAPSALDGSLSHINVNGTNWGRTTFFEVPLVEFNDFGTYTNDKVDGAGIAEAHVTYELTNPTAETASFNISKSGVAAYDSWGTWSSANGFIYFSLGTDTTFTLDSTITSTNTTNYQWFIRQFNTGSSLFDDLFSASATIGGNASLAQVAGNLGVGDYEFYWGSRNSNWNVYGSFAQTFSLDLTAQSVPEPSIIALFAAGLFGLGFARRKVRS